MALEYTPGMENEVRQHARRMAWRVAQKRHLPFRDEDAEDIAGLALQVVLDPKARVVDKENGEKREITSLSDAIRYAVHKWYREQCGQELKFKPLNDWDRDIEDQSTRDLDAVQATRCLRLRPEQESSPSVGEEPIDPAVGLGDDEEDSPRSFEEFEEACAAGLYGREGKEVASILDEARRLRGTVVVREWKGIADSERTAHRKVAAQIARLPLRARSAMQKLRAKIDGLPVPPDSIVIYTIQQSLFGDEEGGAQ